MSLPLFEMQCGQMKTVGSSNGPDTAQLIKQEDSGEMNNFLFFKGTGLGSEGGGKINCGVTGRFQHHIKVC